MMESTVWTRARSHTHISLCEAADIEFPDIPFRSWAYRLAPTGIGTPSTESLTSYFIRLAELHLVTPRIFFLHSMSKAGNEVSQETTPYTYGLTNPSASNATHQINGNGLAAEKWVRSIEELTQQSNLCFLTFLPWKGVISSRAKYRRSRAWCPSCLEDQFVAGISPHEQLRWSHKLVQMCPDHKVRLETECPHCRSSSVALCGRSRPGLCSRCNGWLGFYPNNVSPDLSENYATNESIEMFIAEQIGELIAIAPHLTCLPTQGPPKISITKCVRQFFDGNFRAFVRFFGMRRGNDYFYKGKPRSIDLELLLKLAFYAGTTLLNLLTNENALADFNPLASKDVTSTRLSPRLKKENVLTKLLEALEEKPPPSPHAIAQRLGYRHVHTLRRYFPQVFDQLRANYLTYSRGKRKGGWSTKRLQSNEVILAALEAALKEELPPTLTEVARSLGYVTSQAVRPKFPDICKALTQKRRKIVSDRRAKIEGELRHALESDPPVSLNAISGKLGYKTTAMLRTGFPKECSEIRQRYEAHTRDQLLSKIGVALRAILVEIPPPPLNASLRRIGVSDKFLSQYFPKEHRAISARYLEFRHQQSSENKKIEKERIRIVVMDLINREIFPSIKAVLERTSTTYLRRTEVWAALLEAREEFFHSS